MKFRVSCPIVRKYLDCHNIYGPWGLIISSFPFGNTERKGNQTKGRHFVIRPQNIQSWMRALILLLFVKSVRYVNMPSHSFFLLFPSLYIGDTSPCILHPMREPRKRVKDRNKERECETRDLSKWDVLALQPVFCKVRSVTCDVLYSGIINCFGAAWYFI